MGMEGHGGACLVMVWSTFWSTCLDCADGDGSYPHRLVPVLMGLALHCSVEPLDSYSLLSLTSAYPSMASAKKKDDEFPTRLLAAFSKNFGSASAERPNVRCASRATLISELIALRDHLAHPGTKSISGKSMLDSLVRSGIVHPIHLNTTKDGELGGEFFTIGMDEALSQLDPIELLQAIVPGGVVCYFTAIHFHDLSTQIPTHHHIARLVDTPTKPRKPAQPPPSKNSSVQRSTLGKLQFSYQSVPYYTTNRDRRRVAGIQTRYLSNKTIFSVTTFEQTLLDTLHHPFSCGGQSVVFEAWENAIENLDQHRLLEHLETINDHRLDRRVGYFLMQHLECSLEAQLQERLETAIKRSLIHDVDRMVPLLPGHQYTHTDTHWRLEVP